MNGQNTSLYFCHNIILSPDTYNSIGHGVGGWKHFGAWWWAWLWLAGPGWAQVFTRLPVAAWAPTSPHSSLAPPYLALQPRSSAGTPGSVGLCERQARVLHLQLRIWRGVSWKKEGDDRAGVGLLAFACMRRLLQLQTASWFEFLARTCSLLRFKPLCSW